MPEPIAMQRNGMIIEVPPFRRKLHCCQLKENIPRMTLKSLSVQYVIVDIVDIMYRWRNKPKFISLKQW